MKLLIDSKDYDQIISIGRAILGYSNERVQEIQADFNQLNELDLPHVDDVFCCLGTTIKKAGSQDNFKRVDLDFVISTAQLGLKNGASKMMVISAVGADEKSSFFYNRVKGEMERKIQELQFDSVYIFRPSVLGGNRNEFRFGEKLGTFVMKVFSWLFFGKLTRYKIVPARKVAHSMIVHALKNSSGRHIIESEEINALPN
jgi:uncharacterized protein YbjT (DUF2867 family)